MSLVIGQGIALSEKWPGIFVVAERGNDFETRAARGKGVGEDERREEQGTWTSPREPVFLMRERAGAQITHTRVQSSLSPSLSCECLRDARDATHVSYRVCTFMQFVTRGTGIFPLK